jgi:hypothetical protein
VPSISDLFATHDESSTSRYYCMRLAAIVLLPGYVGSFKSALTHRERSEILKEPVSWETLTGHLEKSPRLQSIAASCTSYTPSVWLLEQELIARGVRDETCKKRHEADPAARCDATAIEVYRLAQRVNSSGLCLSGGGIRSATFNLGVLQGLAKLELFDKFDYLSTVSGGGYIHQFLAAWLYNRNCLLSSGIATNAKPTIDTIEPLESSTGPSSDLAFAEAPVGRELIPAQSSSAATGDVQPLKEVQDQLKPLPWEPTSPDGSMTEQPEPIRWLRRYSNYLTPNKGLFTTDTWVMVAIWLRNTFLNQLALVSLLGTILLIPHLLRWIGGCGVWHHWYKWPRWNCGAANGYLLPIVFIMGFGVGACCLVISALRIARQGRIDLDGVASRGHRCSPETGKNDGPDRSGAGRWMWLLGILTSIAAVFSPALYEASFVPGDTLKIALLENCKGGRDPQDCATAMSSNSDASGSVASRPPSPTDVSLKERALVRHGLPDLAYRLNFVDNGKDRRFLVGQWFGHFSYPLWLWQSDPGFWVEMAFLLFTFSFCLSSGLASLDANPGLGLVWCVVGSTVGAASAWGTLYLSRLGMFLLCFWKPQEVPQIAFVLLPVSVLTGLFLALVLTAGVVGRRTDDSLREAMARLRALAFLLSFIWIGISGFSLIGSSFFNSLVGISQGPWHWKQWTACLGWMGGTLGGVWAGNSGKSSGNGVEGSLLMTVLVKAGPPIFIIGVLLLLSQMLQMMLNAFGGDQSIGEIWIFCGFLLTAILFGSRLDINDFSMHAFYRDRLARCYAGASYPRRRPNRFTGFAQSDGRILVADLLPEKFQKGQSAGIAAKQTADTSGDRETKPYPGPFPIFCTAVNLTFGQDLAWQERKAASFAFTPLYSGYSPGWTSDYSVVKENKRHGYNGFVSTREFAYEGGGIPMHSAVAISGAAISPNWGYHSDPAMAFLLTMFNVRLGWWIKNPRVNSPIQLLNSPSPPFPLWNLFSELVGRATDMSHYVYLTDGGHFDNMGLYELVRRRCRRILICDAEQDGMNLFDGIGSAIRKCRVDWGVEIDLDLGKMDPTLGASGSAPRTPMSPVHFVQGSIKYPEDDERGTVLYIKTSITGDEPGDVLNYNRQHRGFPHESTLDQWFTESQFESYRRLGYHCVLDNPPTVGAIPPVTTAVQNTSLAPGETSTAGLSVGSLGNILQKVFL